MTGGKAPITSLQGPGRVSESRLTGVSSLQSGVSHGEGGVRAARMLQRGCAQTDGAGLLRLPSGAGVAAGASRPRSWAAAAAGPSLSGCCSVSRALSELVAELRGAPFPHSHFHSSDAEANITRTRVVTSLRAPAGSLPHPLGSLGVRLPWPQPATLHASSAFRATSAQRRRSRPSPYTRASSAG